jgi:glycosyltransferase involved in cell wall biosynthesis
MLSHDQHLDRRILAQAKSLIQLGHKVTLLALSYKKEGCEEQLPEGIHLVRIGLDRIIPENASYQQYTRIQNSLNTLLNKFTNKLPLVKLWNVCFRLPLRMNWLIYRFLLYVRYHNRSMGDPLPFKRAFYSAALSFLPDIIQVHDLPVLEAGVGLSQQWNIPLVYDAHELYPEQRTFSYAQRKVCADNEKKYIQFCSLVFAVNDSIADEMAKRYQIERPITLTNAIDPPDEFYQHISYNLIREKLNLAASRKILLFQGGFSKYRNLENLIDAMKSVKNPDIDLVMIGFGDYETILKRKAERKGLLNKRIYFLKAVPQSELLQHSASADIGIIPYPHVDLNSYYCTPNKLFEFIQAGLPILANDSPELRRFVQREGFGMVSPMHSSQQIAYAIDKAFAELMSSAWKQQLMEHRSAFTWKVQSKIYFEGMKHLLESRISLSNKKNTID